MMDKNVKIAKELVRLAKSLVAVENIDVRSLFDNKQFIEIAKLARDTKDPRVLDEIANIAKEKGAVHRMIALKMSENPKATGRTLETIYEICPMSDILRNSKVSQEFLKKTFSSLRSKNESPHALIAILQNSHCPMDIADDILAHNGYGWDDVKGLAYKKVNNIDFNFFDYALQ